MLPERERLRLALCDGDEVAAGFADDIFPAGGIARRMLDRRADNTADNAAAERAERRRNCRGIGLGREDAAGSAPGHGANRAVIAYFHLAEADDDAARDLVRLLRRSRCRYLANNPVYNPQEARNSSPEFQARHVASRNPFRRKASRFFRLCKNAGEANSAWNAAAVSRHWSSSSEHIIRRGAMSGPILHGFVTFLV